jgi:hypothetical protein
LVASWCSQSGDRRMILGPARQTRRMIGYVRDATVILSIVIGGMYVMSEPEKFDLFLNWMLGRPR